MSLRARERSRSIRIIFSTLTAAGALLWALTAAGCCSTCTDVDAVTFDQKVEDSQKNVDSHPPPSRKSRHKRSEAVSPKVKISAKVRAVELHPRNPAVKWTMDLTVRNEGDAMAWVIISANLISGLGKVKAGAGAYLYRAQSGDFVMAQLYSSPAPAEAIPIPAGADLTIRNLSVDSWSYDAHTSLEVVCASGILIDGAPIASTWLAGKSLENPSSGEVDLAGRKKVHSALNPGLKEEPLRFDQAVTLKVPLNLEGVALPNPVEANRR